MNVYSFLAILIVCCVVTLTIHVQSIESAKPPRRTETQNPRKTETQNPTNTKIQNPGTSETRNSVSTSAISERSPVERLVTWKLLLQYLAELQPLDETLQNEVFKQLSTLEKTKTENDQDAVFRNYCKQLNDYEVAKASAIRERAVRQRWTKIKETEETIDLWKARPKSGAELGNGMYESILQRANENETGPIAYRSTKIHIICEGLKNTMSLTWSRSEVIESNEVIPVDAHLGLYGEKATAIQYGICNIPPRLHILLGPKIDKRQYYFLAIDRIHLRAHDRFYMEEVIRIRRNYPKIGIGYFEGKADEYKTRTKKTKSENQSSSKQSTGYQRLGSVPQEKVFSVDPNTINTFKEMKKSQIEVAFRYEDDPTEIMNNICHSLDSASTGSHSGQSINIRLGSSSPSDKNKMQAMLFGTCKFESNLIPKLFVFLGRKLEEVEHYLFAIDENNEKVVFESYKVKIIKETILQANFS